MIDAQRERVETKLRSFLRHPAFRALRTRSERFRPMEAFGIAHHEHSHSNFLAFLLDPDAKHGLQGRFLTDFIALAADAQPFRCGCENRFPLTAELAVNPAKVHIHRERHNIDVLIDCLPLGPVIGIEAKIWAEEQDRQIERYQNRLASTYAGRQGLIVFLTPDGRQPETGKNDHKVPYSCIQWLAVAELIDGVLGTGENEAARPFMREFVNHLRELSMGSEEDKALVGSLFKDPDMVKAFNCIERLRPRFWDQSVMDALEEKGKALLRQITGSEIHVERVQKRVDAALTFLIEDWNRRGVPLRFTFYHDPTWNEGSQPGLHALLLEFDSLVGAEQEKYRSIARQCESLAVEPISARGWSRKHSAFQNPPDGHSLGWVTEDESFDAEWIDNAINRLAELVKQIQQELESTSGKSA